MINELQLIANAVKHGEGHSAADLHQVRPDLFVLPQFKGSNTTTEYLTRHVFDQIAAAGRAGKLGRDGRALKSVRVAVAESPVARAWYEAPLW